MYKESYSTAATNFPDQEDINSDNTLSDNESYYQYHLSLRPEDMEIGKNRISDMRFEKVKLANGSEDSVKWFQFKVPIYDFDDRVGSIGDFKSIRFMRMFLTNFRKDIVLRFATMELVRGEWRRYQQPLEIKTYQPLGQMEVSAVNFEENSDREPVNYILPPGVDRLIDPGQPQLRQLNEQSMALKVNKLAPQDARSVYKNIRMDLRQFRKLQMWVHAESFPTDDEKYTDIEDGDMTVFVRLGSDFKNNYYEYELPLKLTPHFSRYDDTKESDRYTVWPIDNRLDINLDLLTDLKLKRNSEKRQSGSGIDFLTEYSQAVKDKSGHFVKVKGNPTLSEVKVIMIGVRNSLTKSVEYRSGEIWINELRLTDFNEDGGWAGMTNIGLQLADLGTVNFSGNISTAGFGGIEQRLMDRQLEDMQNINMSTSLQLGKFFPENAKVNLPLYYSYSQNSITPKYNPLDEDVLLSDALETLPSQEEKDSLISLTVNKTTRKAISLSNVKVHIASKKRQFYDPANFGLDFAYNETKKKTATIDHDLKQDYRGRVKYN